MQTETRKKTNGHSMHGRAASAGIDKKAVNEIAKSMRTLREARATAGADKSPEAASIVIGQLRMVARNLGRIADGIEKGGQ